MPSPSPAAAGRRIPPAAKFLLPPAALVALALLLLLTEGAMRACSSVHFQGNSTHLFVDRAFGASHGNAPNVEAVSFGVTVHTDEHGFRVPAGGLPPGDHAEGAILLLGDSVAFAAGVEDGSTAVGLLRSRYPRRRIYDASVIGYNTTDYVNVVERFVPAHPEITQVVLVYCLNDAGRKSAEQIDRALAAREAGYAAEGGALVDTLRGIGFVNGLNDLLRARSKLWVTAKGLLTDAQRRYWLADLALYTGDTPLVRPAVADIERVAQFLRPRAIAFTVVVPPYEYQLRRPQDPASETPFRSLGELLSAAGVQWIDARPFFDPAVASRDYFLAYDPMHLSPAGQRVLAEILVRAVETAATDLDRAALPRADL